MRTLRAVPLVVGLLVSTVCLAQVEVGVRVGLPSIHFEVAPPLVVVSSGVHVVEDYDHEVFFVDGFYWYRDGDTWFHTRDHRGGWVVVEHPRVPRTIVKLAPGKYKHFKSRKGKTVHAGHGDDAHRKAKKAKGGRKGGGKGKGRD
jgi:hypothetical protein